MDNDVKINLNISLCLACVDPSDANLDATTIFRNETASNAETIVGGYITVDCDTNYVFNNGWHTNQTKQVHCTAHDVWSSDTECIPS